MRASSYLQKDKELLSRGSNISPSIFDSPCRLEILGEGSILRSNFIAHRALEISSQCHSVNFPHHPHPVKPTHIRDFLSSVGV